MEAVADIDQMIALLPSMAALTEQEPAWGVTPARVQDAVRRIVEAANPVKIVAFGSWARGEARPESDLDLAVIVDDASTEKRAGHVYLALDGVDMSMDILTFTKERHELFKTSVNSVHGDIAREGVVLYERSHDGLAVSSYAA